MKKCLVLFLFLITTLNIYADCPHCYRVARVLINLKNGQEFYGYAPLYSGDLDINQNFKEKQELKTEVELHEKNISFTKETYSREPYFHFLIKSEEIQEIMISEIVSIKFIKWTDLYGAGKLNQVKSSIVEKLLSNKISYYKMINKGAEDILYISTDTSFNSKDFGFFLSIIYGEKAYESPLRSYPSKYDESTILDSTSIYIIAKDIKVFKHRMNEYFLQLSKNECTDEKIKTYIALMKHNFEIEQKYLDMSYDYLMNKNNAKLKEFIEQNLSRIYTEVSIQNEYKNNYFYSLYNTVDEKDYLKYFIKLLRVYNLFNDSKEMNEIQDKILKQENLYTLHFYGD
jgi:hypothetical protein